VRVCVRSCIVIVVRGAFVRACRMMDLCAARIHPTNRFHGAHHLCPHRQPIVFTEHTTFGLHRLLVHYYYYYYYYYCFFLFLPNKPKTNRQFNRPATQPTDQQHCRSLQTTRTANANGERRTQTRAVAGWLAGWLAGGRGGGPRLAAGGCVRRADGCPTLAFSMTHVVSYSLQGFLFSIAFIATHNGGCVRA
jgi:hypothetical protein